MITDKVADMLTRVRNGYLGGKKEVVVPHSTLKAELARVMTEENYLEGFEMKKDDKGFQEIRVTLKYVDDKPAVNKIKRISKPGLRVYKRAHELTPVLSGMGVAILSTSKGIMTGKNAKKQNLGGEVLCELW